MCFTALNNRNRKCYRLKCRVVSWDSRFGPGLVINKIFYSVMSRSRSMKTQNFLTPPKIIALFS